MKIPRDLFFLKDSTWGCYPQRGLRILSAMEETPEEKDILFVTLAKDGAVTLYADEE